ncbi:MAG: M81 family peptidase [Limnohabitans sp.]|nr:MAG: M81 family peptidase [Limnohabitans sp.]
MTRILIAGYQHETNTFAPSLADWAAFNTGENFPAYVRGQAMVAQMTGLNIPVGGFIDAARREGWQLVPSAWAGATPSSYVTRDAFERISAAILEDVRAAMVQGLDGVYLDLHGAAVADHADDSEGELIARIRAVVGPRVPIVASLDLHANVTQRMLALSDGLVSYRTYPHIDMAETGERAARLLREHLRSGRKADMQARRLPFLIALNAQSTWMSPAREVYDELAAIEARTGCVLSFCMGFPASDFDECGPVVWGHGGAAEQAVQQLFERVGQPQQWRPEFLSAHEAVQQSLALAAQHSAPVVMADTQDNPGAGGDSNTTGMLHALLAQGAGRQWPGQVALGLLYDPEAARKAHEAGVGATLELALGKAVPTFTGQPSDPPVQGRFVVRALGDDVCEIRGPMMTGVKVRIGPCACLEMDGVLIAVASGKMQMLDRELFRAVGIQPEQMKLLVCKSSNHFRADFTPIASRVLVAKAAGPMAADPGDLPWKKLNAKTRTRP